MTTKFMNYKFEPGIVDPDNPLAEGNFCDLFWQVWAELQIKRF